MKRVKVVFFSFLPILAFLRVVGCPVLPRMGGYIKVQIDCTEAPKGLAIGVFEVTGLRVQVWDPEGEVLETIAWDAGDGPCSYLVPVERAGEHEVEVIHLGEGEGREVQAAESAVFYTRARGITIVDIVPGCIGVIRIETEASQVLPAGTGFALGLARGGTV